jgi:uncharacterized protein YkwD
LSPDKRYLSALLLVAVLGCGCKSEPRATEGSGADASSANADRVVVTTLAPEPTRRAEQPTPTQSPASTTIVSTPTQLLPTATQTLQPTQTPSPSPSATLSPTASPSASPTPTGTVTGSTTLDSREQTIYAHHNAERASRDIAPLDIDPTLQAIARQRAQIMADNQLFSHVNPNGDTIYDMFADADYDWADATENIHFNDYAASQADAVAMSEYMASAAHRANILKPGFHRVGVGVATSSAGVHYYSVVFSD